MSPTIPLNSIINWFWLIKISCERSYQNPFLRLSQSNRFLCLFAKCKFNFGGQFSDHLTPKPVNQMLNKLGGCYHNSWLDLDNFCWSFMSVFNIYIIKNCLIKKFTLRYKVVKWCCARNYKTYGSPAERSRANSTDGPLTVHICGPEQTGPRCP